LQASIREVVRLLWAENREVPLIAACHKEAAGELLALNEEDKPDTTSREEAQRRADRQQPEAPEGTVQASFWDPGLLARKKRATSPEEAQRRTDCWQPEAHAGTAQVNWVVRHGVCLPRWRVVSCNAASWVEAGKP